MLFDLDDVFLLNLCISKAKFWYLGSKKKEKETLLKLLSELVHFFLDYKQQPWQPEK